MLIWKRQHANQEISIYARTTVIWKRHTCDKECDAHITYILLNDMTARVQVASQGYLIAYKRESEKERNNTYIYNITKDNKKEMMMG